MLSTNRRIEPSSVSIGRGAGAVLVMESEFVSSDHLCPINDGAMREITPRTASAARSPARSSLATLLPVEPHDRKSHGKKQRGRQPKGNLSVRIRSDTRSRGAPRRQETAPRSTLCWTSPPPATKPNISTPHQTRDGPWLFEHLNTHPAWRFTFREAVCNVRKRLISKSASREAERRYGRKQQ